MAKKTAEQVERITKKIAETTGFNLSLIWPYGNKVQLYIVSENNPRRLERSLSPILSYSEYCDWANAFLDGFYWASKNVDEKGYIIERSS